MDSIIRSRNKNQVVVDQELQARAARLAKPTEEAVQPRASVRVLVPALDAPSSLTSA